MKESKRDQYILFFALAFGAAECIFLCGDQLLRRGLDGHGPKTSVIVATISGLVREGHEMRSVFELRKQGVCARCQAHTVCAFLFLMLSYALAFAQAET